MPLQLEVFSNCAFCFRRSGAEPEILNADATGPQARHVENRAPDIVLARLNCRHLGHCEGPPPCRAALYMCFSLARTLSWVPDLHLHVLSLPNSMSSMSAYVAFVVESLLTDWCLKPTPLAGHHQCLSKDSQPNPQLPASALCQPIVSMCRQAHTTMVTLHAPTRKRGSGPASGILGPVMRFEV